LKRILKQQQGLTLEDFSARLKGDNQPDLTISEKIMILDFQNFGLLMKELLLKSDPLERHVQEINQLENLLS